jgi:hypothetical protein
MAGNVLHTHQSACQLNQRVYCRDLVGYVIHGLHQIKFNLQLYLYKEILLMGIYPFYFTELNFCGSKV